MLTNKVKTTRVMDAVAAGTTSQNGSSVDMANFESVRFTAMFGALTATQTTSLKAQQSDDDGSADDWTDIEGSDTGPMGDDDDNDCLILDLTKVQKRYVRPVVVRGVANAVIDGVIADQYGPRNEPVTQDATIIATNQLVSPAEGTA